MNTILMTLVLLACQAAQPSARPAPLPAAPTQPRALALLERCAEALRSSRGWRCQLRFDGVGTLTARTPQIRANALWVRAGAPWSGALVIEARAKLPAALGNQPPVEQEYRSDGTRVVVDNLGWKLRVTSPSTAQAFASLQLDTLLPPALRAETPFADWDPSTLQVDEPALLGGTPCHRVRYGDGTQRLWIEAGTGRPRAFETSIRATGSKRLVLDGLAPVESPASTHFAAPPRTGWRHRDLSDMVDPPPSHDAAKTGEVVAPFSLRRPNGTTWSLGAATAQVLVIDFFATWCGPCKLAMPTLRELSKQHASDQVQVVGISTWETGDPAALYAKLGLDYELLLDGDAVAEQLGVKALPTVLVLDRSGRIHARLCGHSADIDRQLRRAVRDLLAVQ